MASKCAINTPFGSSEGTVAKTPSTKGVTGTYDKHRTPILSKPHSMGKDTIPLKFFSGDGTKIGPLTPNPEKFQTPFGNTLTSAGALNRHKSKSGD
jgi:hypothetical protein